MKMLCSVAKPFARYSGVCHVPSVSLYFQNNLIVYRRYRGELAHSVAWCPR